MYEDIKNDEHPSQREKKNDDIVGTLCGVGQESMSPDSHSLSLSRWYRQTPRRAGSPRGTHQQRIHTTLRQIWLVVRMGNVLTQPPRNSFWPSAADRPVPRPAGPTRHWDGLVKVLVTRAWKREHAGVAASNARASRAGLMGQPTN